MATVPLPPSDKGLTFPVQSSALYHRNLRRRTVETYTFDEIYVSRLASGDTPTTEHFVRYFYKLLLVKLRSKMRASDLAEDVAQETLCRVIHIVRRDGGIHSPEKLGAYVNSVCDNVVLETIRQSGRFQQVPENALEPVERALDAERSYITNEQKDAIRRELAKLKKSDQVLLSKVFLLELDKDAICAEMNIDRNYLRVQVFRALARFREVLKKGGNGKANGAAAS